MLQLVQKVVGALQGEETAAAQLEARRLACVLGWSGEALRGLFALKQVRIDAATVLLNEGLLSSNTRGMSFDHNDRHGDACVVRIEAEKQHLLQLKLLIVEPEY